MRKINWMQMIQLAATDVLAGDGFEEALDGPMGPIAAIIIKAIADRAKIAADDPAIAMKIAADPQGYHHLPTLADLIKDAGYSIEFEPGKAGVHARVFGKRDAEQAAELAKHLADKERSKTISDADRKEMERIVKLGGERPMVAYGYSNSEDDSLLHAVLGAVREEHQAAHAAAAAVRAEEKRKLTNAGTG